MIAILDIAANVGFDGVEIWGRAPHMCELYDADYVSKLKDEVTKRGLELSMFGSYLYANSERFGEELPVALKIAQGLGAPIMRTWAANQGSGEATEALWEVSARNFKQLCKRAKDLGIDIAIERHASTLADEIDSALKFIDMVGADNLKVNYQVAEHENDEAVAEGIEKLGYRVVNVHAHNFIRTPSGVDGTAISEGIIDYRRLVEKLRVYGFSGFIEVEFVRRPGITELPIDERTKELCRDYEFLRAITRGAR